jgi:hypothetical protein
VNQEDSCGLRSLDTDTDCLLEATIETKDEKGDDEKANPNGNINVVVTTFRDTIKTSASAKCRGQDENTACQRDTEYRKQAQTNHNAGATL